MDYLNLTNHELALLLHFAAKTGGIDTDLLVAAAARIDPDAEEFRLSHRNERYRDMLRQGKKIQAIKAYREEGRPGAFEGLIGLKEAKDFIDCLEVEVNEERGAGHTAKLPSMGPFTGMSVPCPMCGAGIGVACQMGPGIPPPPHDARKAAAEREIDPPEYPLGYDGDLGPGRGPGRG